MAYVVEKAEDKFIDAISRPEGWVERNPAYADLFEDNRRLRNEHQESGAFGRIKSPEWRVVARFPSTLEDAIRLTKDGGFIKDKPEFYKWLRRNPQYATYDIKSRSGGAHG